MEEKSILIVDDQARARSSLRALLMTLPQTLNVSEAANGLEALHCVAERQPDLIVMDVLMPNMDGITATRLIRALHPTAKIIMLSMYPEYEEVTRSVGALAFVNKGDPPGKLLSTIATFL